MSRSKPTDNQPNPAKQFLEWGGKTGNLSYYDKELKTKIEVPVPFTFILLDSLCTIKGWHDASESRIFSNEIRDTRAETFVVKSFKGEPIAEGFYKDIKDKVAANGGHYQTSLYLGFKEEGKLVLGNLQLKGAALREWMEFQKEHRGEIYKQAITISGSISGKKGSVVFKVPTFELTEISEATDKEAKALDEVLQTYLDGYFKRTRVEQVVDHDFERPDIDQREEEIDLDKIISKDDIETPF